jgi:hypothetical protein
MKKLKLIVLTVFLFLVGLTFMPQSIMGYVEKDTDCHENGHCVIVCGPEDTTFCIYAVCGQGTQSCMKE